MAEILIKSQSVYNQNPVKDVFCYKRGHCVDIREDGFRWGWDEGPPKFMVLKLPGIPAKDIKKYIGLWSVGVGDERIVLQRREWKISVDDLSKSEQEKLETEGLTIKATDDYLGPYDKTWNDTKSLFVNERTGLPETDNLSGISAL